VLFNLIAKESFELFLQLELVGQLLKVLVWFLFVEELVGSAVVGRDVLPQVVHFISHER
jgi:hypothetical protein